MRFRFTAIVFVACLLMPACGGGPEPGPDGPAGGDDVVASIAAIPARAGALAAEQTAYGTVVPVTGTTVRLSVPYESRLQAWHVTPGQAVDADEALASVVPSADAEVLLAQAASALTAERTKLDAVQQRYDLGLATEEELAVQRQAFDDARARSESLGATAGARVLRAPVAGTVDSVFVREGTLAPASTPLVGVVPAGRLEARLGVDPAHAQDVRPGQTVLLSPLYRSPGTRWRGTVRHVARRVDPVTHLSDVFVTPDDASRLVLGEYVQGRLAVARSDGVIVPHPSVLPEEDRYVLFTVSGGRARRHVVQVRLETDQEALVAGDVQAGDSVVVLGNYELTDGMRVRVDASLAVPAPGDSSSSNTGRGSQR